MIQSVVAAAMKEVMGGVMDGFPKPLLAGKVRITVVFEVDSEGKLVLKKGSEVEVDLNLRLGDD